MANRGKEEPTGVVQLDSGLWNWAAVADSSGWRLAFRHHVKPRDAMVARVGGSALDAAALEEAARTPLHRYWEDADGELWRVSLEVAALPPHRRGLFRHAMMVVFRAGSLRVEVPVPGEPPIGELTDLQLSSLLSERAGPQPSRDAPRARPRPTSASGL